MNFKLGLADHVSTECLVVGLDQSFKGCSVLVIAERGNPGVCGPEVRSDRKEGSVGNELPPARRP